MFGIDWVVLMYVIFMYLFELEEVNLCVIVILCDWYFGILVGYFGYECGL